MPIERINYWGNPNIGVYMFANDKIALVPPNFEDKLEPIVSSVLRVPVLRVSIAGMNIIGVLIVGNNKGILLPAVVREHEYREIKSHFDGNVAIVKSKYTALGNICLVNDRAALIYPEAYEDLKHVVKDVLEVEVVEKGTIANIPTVGSAAFINNKGGLVHPDASEAELDYLSQLFGVRVDVGTVNFGIGFIRSGLVANNYGVLVGDRTTGPEIMRIMQVFGG